MLQKLIQKRLDAEEQRLGVPLTYLRHISRTSLGAFFKFALFAPLSQHRRALPEAAYYVAKLVSARSEDCGTCVQIEVNLARQAGVPATAIRAVLEDRPADLTPELADVYHFARAVAERTGDDEAWRTRMRDRFGEGGLVELALALATAQVFPITKRALGYAKACALVEIEMADGDKAHTTALTQAAEHS